MFIIFLMMIINIFYFSSFIHDCLFTSFISSFISRHIIIIIIIYYYCCCRSIISSFSFLSSSFTVLHAILNEHNTMRIIDNHLEQKNKNSSHCSALPQFT